MVGRTLKHYRVESTLGRGGMGVVYRAVDTRLGRPVALKVLPEELSLDADRKRRFLLEAKAACAVNHPAIAQVYDVDDADGVLFIAMELVEGRTVRDLVQGRELDVLGAIEIARQVAGGLAKAHEAGIVHRDVKAENVMVTPDGHAKLLDFGLAKLRVPDSGPIGADDRSRMETIAGTQAGMVLGTLRYMSPEQARGREVDHRSDLFSLGVVLYEMVTGEAPFTGDSPVDTLHAVAFEETRPITAIRPNLPPSLQRVVTRCLRKRPEDRYPDARELAADLRTVQREIESGVSGAVPLVARVKEGLRAFRGAAPSDKLVPILAAVLVVVLVLAVVLAGGESVPGTILLGVLGLYVYRWFRHRRRRLLRRFTERTRKLPEVRAIVAAERHVTVVVDRAVASTFVRINATLERVNRRLFFGEPFTVSVRDDLDAAGLRALLVGPGVLWVREPDGAVSGRRS